MEEIPSIKKKYRKDVENEDDETEEGDEGREVKKRKKLTDKEKGMIEGLDRAGWTERDMAEEVKCSQLLENCGFPKSRNPGKSGIWKNAPSNAYASCQKASKNSYPEGR